MRYTGVIERTFTVVGTHGEEVQCMCPWHDDKSGHLYVNAVRGLYFCQSCGEKGSLLSSKDGRAVRLPPAGTDDVRRKIEQMRAPKREQSFHPEGWRRQFDQPHDYWVAVRGLSPRTVKQFRLGFDPFVPFVDYIEGVARDGKRSELA